MAPFKKKPQIDTLPGEGLSSAITRFKAAQVVAEHIGIPQIIDDHQLMWLEANSDSERAGVHRRFRRQLVRGMVSFGGFEVAVHGVVSTAVGQFLVGSSLILVGAMIVYLTKR